MKQEAESVAGAMEGLERPLLRSFGSKKGEKFSGNKRKHGEFLRALWN